MKLDLFVYYLFPLCNYCPNFLLQLLATHYYAGIILYCPLIVAGIENLTWIDIKHEGAAPHPSLINNNDDIFPCSGDNWNCAQNGTQGNDAAREEAAVGGEDDGKAGGLQSAIEFAVHLSSKDCQQRFKWSRWNCSESTWMANTGTKENAYMTASLSAAVTYSIAKACARGDISNCGCAPPTTIASSSGSSSGNYDKSGSLASSSLLHQGGYWRWGGCSADVDFAVKLARRSTQKMIRTKSPSISADNMIEKDVLHAVVAHNKRVGRNIVSKSLDTDCKCHGVSGSCTLKTCWMKLPQFGKIGKMIFNLYKKSSLIIAQDNLDGRHVTRINKSINNSTLSPKRRRVHLEVVDQHGGKPSRGELIHLVTSPTYCEQEGIYHPGTKGRRCLRSSSTESPSSEDTSEGSCSILCCGRGYNTHVTWRRWKCHCAFHWCCVVECQDCQEKVQLYTCN